MLDDARIFGLLLKPFFAKSDDKEGNNFSFEKAK